MLSETPVPGVLDLLGLHGHRTAVLKELPGEIGNWLVEAPGGGRVVLRRYHARAAQAELAYEEQRPATPPRS